MRSRVLGFFALALALVGFGASTASLIDYYGDVPTFCAESGCATVRASEWSHPLGIPLAAFGVAYFTVMIALSFLPRLRLRIALAAIGAAFAVGFIVLQAAVIGAWCKLCLVADPAAIAGGLAVIGGATTVRVSLRNLAATVPAAGLVVLGLGLWTNAPAEPEQPLPECVAREQIAGKVTIVEFVDFECPFCRALDKKLTVALDRTRQPVRIVRKMVPIVRDTAAAISTTQGRQPHTRKTRAA